MSILQRIGARSGLLLIVAIMLLTSGCAIIVSSAANSFSNNLSAAVIGHTDPETVRDGMPAYILLLDTLLQGNPDDPALLAAAANLYASYGAVFVADPARAARLTERAKTYSVRALCLSFAPSCEWENMTFEQYEASLAGLASKHGDVVYAYSVSSLSYIRAHSDDWNALARLPHMDALLNRYLEISDGEAEGSVYTYLGILATLRPPALGGEPEKGRRYFEHAIDLSGGHDLSAKVELARGYARPLYERELHDRLLQEVLAADPEFPGYTLTNVLAQRDASELLSSADDYF